MSPFILGAYIGFGGAVLVYMLSFFARKTSGYQRPLDPFGPFSVFERDVSRYEAFYNRNPKMVLRMVAMKFLILGIFGFILDLFLG
jgi:hypothetical protein